MQGYVHLIIYNFSLPLNKDLECVALHKLLLSYFSIFLFPSTFPFPISILFLLCVLSMLFLFRKDHQRLRVSWVSVCHVVKLSSFIISKLSLDVFSFFQVPCDTSKMHWHEFLCNVPQVNLHQDLCGAYDKAKSHLHHTQPCGIDWRQLLVSRREITMNIFQSSQAPKLSWK